MSTDEESRKAQLESLNQQLEKVKKMQPETAQPKVSGDAARSAIDFASATAVGTGLGYGFDVWQGTLPWGLLVGLLIGTGAGLKLMFQEEARQARRNAEATKMNDEQ